MECHKFLFFVPQRSSLTKETWLQIQIVNSVHWPPHKGRSPWCLHEEAWSFMNISWHGEALEIWKTCRAGWYPSKMNSWDGLRRMISFNFQVSSYLATDICTREAPNWIGYIPGDVPSTDENSSFEDPGLASNSIHFLANHETHHFRTLLDTDCFKNIPGHVKK